MIDKLQTSYFAHPQGSVFNAIRPSRFNVHEISMFGNENDTKRFAVSLKLLHMFAEGSR